ncbi:Asp-tRNA(Asn)/Glu-tRNA(Gln) amidotransferase subunit GatA [Acidaminobacter sp.]|uniref:Asp-tRNA(Asn)/Glu-tRNA(Gln) amidotransferase subunit GatA n=1 Tax=Acidaminobacter sp. TaxID=1872102 RepID=UPI002F41C677
MKKMNEFTLAESLSLLGKKEISSQELVSAYFEQIDRVDAEVGAWITLDRQGALRQAARIDDHRLKGLALGPLAGVPGGLKDNLCTTTMPTTCASKMLVQYTSPFDATVVEKLAGADAVILGKLNMDEFAMGSSTENSYIKPVRNPVDLTRVPGGSSGGSAAAVASFQAAFTLGSDTGGSIRQPAAFCGVVGLKPTYGAVSRYGLIAFASSLDQIGPLTRDVTDLAHVMNVLAGHDPRDSTSVTVDWPDFRDSLRADVKGMKIALPKEYFGKGLNPEVKAAVLEAARRFELLGADVDEVGVTTMEYALPAYYLISSAEASSNLARFDGVQYGYRADDFEDLRDLYVKTRSQGFGKEVKRRILLGTYALSSGYYDAYYKKAQQVRGLIRKEFSDLFKTYDLILSPVAPTTAWKLGEKSKDPLEMYMEDIYTVPINIAGVPAISVPCGKDTSGMPVGMQLIGKPFDEKTLIRAAYTFEQSVGGWRHDG